MNHHRGVCSDPDCPLKRFEAQAKARAKGLPFGSMTPAEVAAELRDLAGDFPPPPEQAKTPD